MQYPLASTCRRNEQCYTHTLRYPSVVCDPLSVILCDVYGIN